jgi:outer membrane protein TolC
MTAIQGGLTNLLGYTAVVNLNFSWPPQNNVADGLHTQTVAAHRIAQEAERSLKQVIGASVYSSVSGLEKRAKIAFEGMKAARLYEESVQNEEKKLKAGLSTLINLVLTQERLAGARANAITGLQSYAEAILAFRFATGTLMDSGSGSAQIRPQGLLEFPKENK